MAKPDYAAWDRIDEFDLPTAASLACDSEPEAWHPRTHPKPPLIQRMEAALKSKWPPKRTTILGAAYAGFAGETWHHPSRTIETWTRTRAELREWAERTGRLADMPFLLTPEERQGTPKPGPLRADRERNRNAVIGLLTLALVKRGGPGFRQTIQGREGPNLSAVAKELQDLAKEKGLDTTGLSFKSLTDRLNAGQAELAERR